MVEPFLFRLPEPERDIYAHCLDTRDKVESIERFSTLLTRGSVVNYRLWTLKPAIRVKARYWWGPSVIRTLGLTAKATEKYG